MNDNQEKLQKRVFQSAEELLHNNEYVSPIDVLQGIGYLHPVHVKEWRKRKIPYLEKVIGANLKKISFAMKCFRSWAQEKKLIPRETVYQDWNGSSKNVLRFSKSGLPEIERSYRTHYISPELTKKKQEKLKEKWEKSPDPVVFILTKRSECSKCKELLGKGRFLRIQEEHPLCMLCAGLDDFVFLPSGDAKLTRRAKKESDKPVIVMKFSQTRKRYERQGILVEEESLERAESSLRN